MPCVDSELKLENQGCFWQHLWYRKGRCLKCTFWSIGCFLHFKKFPLSLLTPCKRYQRTWFYLREDISPLAPQGLNWIGVFKYSLVYAELVRRGLCQYFSPIKQVTTLPRLWLVTQAIFFFLSPLARTGILTSAVYKWLILQLVFFKYLTLIICYVTNWQRKACICKVRQCYALGAESMSLK